MRLDQAAQVRLARRRLHALDGHNLRVDQGGEVAWWEGGWVGGWEKAAWVENAG